MKLGREYIKQTRLCFIPSLLLLECQMWGLPQTVCLIQAQQTKCVLRIVRGKLPRDLDTWIGNRRKI
jgi:hypothetical protein